MYYNEAAGVYNLFVRLVHSRQLCSRPDWRWQQVVSVTIRSALIFGVNLPWGSTGGLYRGARWEARPEGSTGGLDGRLDRGARPGGSTGGSMEGSTGELVRGGSTGGFYQGGSIHINVYYNEATGDRYLPARFAWTSTWKPWTVFVWDRSDRLSGLTTLCSDIRALASFGKGCRVLHLDEIVIPRTDHPPPPRLDQACCVFHCLGGVQRPSRVLVSTNCGLGRKPSFANLELELPRPRESWVLLPSVCRVLGSTLEVLEVISDEQKNNPTGTYYIDSGINVYYSVATGGHYVPRTISWIWIWNHE